MTPPIHSGRSYAKVTQGNQSQQKAKRPAWGAVVASNKEPASSSNPSTSYVQVVTGNKQQPPENPIHRLVVLGRFRKKPDPLASQAQEPVSVESEMTLVIPQTLKSLPPNQSDPSISQSPSIQQKIQRALNFKAKYQLKTPAQIKKALQDVTKQTADDWYNLAQELRHQKPQDRSLAEEIYKKLLSLPSLSNQQKSNFHLGLSKIASRNHDFKQKNIHLQESLKLNPNNPVALIQYGHLILIKQNQHQTAILLFKRASEQALAMNNLPLQAQALIGLGNARDGDRISHYRAALALAQQIGAPSLQAQALIGLGNAKDGAHIQHYRDALALAQQIEDPSLEAQALIGLGNARDRNDIKHYCDALKLAEDIGDLALQAQALIGLGNASDGNDIQHYHKALALAEQIKDLSLKAQALIGLGNAKDGDIIEHYHKALTFAEQIKDPSLQAKALIGLGNARDRNDIQHYLKALTLAEQIKDLSLQAKALIGLGNARDGDRVSHYHSALALARQLGDPSLQAQALIGLGNARDGDRVSHYYSALALARQLGDPSLQAQALIGLGNARDRNDIQHYRAALKLAEDIGDLSLKAQALIGLGNTYGARHQNEEAAQLFMQALNIAPSPALKEKAQRGNERALSFLELRSAS